MWTDGQTDGQIFKRVRYGTKTGLQINDLRAFKGMLWKYSCTRKYRAKSYIGSKIGYFRAICRAPSIARSEVVIKQLEAICRAPFLFIASAL